VRNPRFDIDFEIKISLIIGLLVIFILLISVEKNTVTINIGDVGLPISAVDTLRKLLGH